MKRHKCLIALSHDHHHGLLLAQLVKKNAPDYQNLPKDIPGKIDYAKKFYHSDLSLHFKKEENALFPAVKGKDKELDELIRTLIAEHLKITHLVFDLDESGNAPAVLDELGHLLEDHIRKEERKLFPLIESNFNDEELEKIERELNAEENRS
ncbi:MAG TPA: hemerythrin domain-containing protein [Ignavibacteriales bacterium]|nr:hemerythrin domain-containing protein [Ignavibacteriales bacterium]